MNRREFLAYGLASAGIAAGSYWGFKHWLEVNPAIYDGGMAQGHQLRDQLLSEDELIQRANATPIINTEVLIVGSGIAGLTAAWRLKKSGFDDFLMLDGPSAFGNASSAQFQFAGESFPYPRAAHYLPLPGPEATLVREILFDLGVIEQQPFAIKPLYRETDILHAPEDRVFYQGRWHEGLIPLAALSSAERAEYQRFAQQMNQLSQQTGADGKRLFVVPSMLSSNDPATRQLDQMTFSTWLQQHNYRSPALRDYLDYCCRDDFGANADQISAWAGLHYHASRNGEAQHSKQESWLTWPQGLGFIAQGLAKSAEAKRLSASLLRLQSDGELPLAYCLKQQGGTSEYIRIQARKVICALPLHVAWHVVPYLQNLGIQRQQLPDYAPWLVTNFLLENFLPEKPGAGLAWDNIVFASRGLGYVVATHQQIRVGRPPATVLTSYNALAEFTPQQARQWLLQATPQQLLNRAAEELQQVYGWQLALNTLKVELSLHGHAMAIPRPGFLTQPARLLLQQQDGPILFAHADLSGFSIFEEASWWGNQAALKVLA